MSKDYKPFLKDIQKHIARIERVTLPLDETGFIQSEIESDSVLFNLMVIGEAVKNIPQDIRDQYPQVRWRDIGRFRDRVVHHYFSLDLKLVWEIVTVHLPVLRVQVDALLQSLPNDSGDAP